MEWIIGEWKFRAALALFLSSNEERHWTPELLKACINGYGVIDGDDDTLRLMLEEYEVDEFKITSLLDRPDKDNIIENSIEVDRENLYGLAKDLYLGMVHFNDMPLSGYLSDLTARFHIKKVDQNQLTLEFLDVHVM